MLDFSALDLSELQVHAAEFIRMMDLVDLAEIALSVAVDHKLDLRDWRINSINAGGGFRVTCNDETSVVAIFSDLDEAKRYVAGRQALDAQALKVRVAGRPVTAVRS